MSQEALHEGLIVKRHILMDYAARQARARKPRRSHGAGGEQHADFRPLGGDGVDHRQRGIGLADAGGMEPDEKAGWPRRAGQTVALGPTSWLLLAAPHAPGKDQRGERRRQAGERPIELDRQPRLDRLRLGQWIAGSGPSELRHWQPIQHGASVLLLAGHGDGLLGRLTGQRSRMGPGNAELGTV